VFLILYFIGLLLLAGLFAVLGARFAARSPRLSRFFAAAFGVVLGYFLAEFTLTAYYGFTWAGTSFYLFDESGKTIHFDPIRGVLLTQVPTRWARLENGTPEYVAVTKGNSQGFPSHTEFGPARPDASTIRLAVFGDSFSAADYIGTNWPDRTEQLAQARGEKLQLLNFSLDGIGLANWWSILTRLVAPENYQLDGIIFVVYESDLERRFFVAENRGNSHTYRRCSEWDPKTYPTTLEQTTSCPSRVQHMFILSSADFDLALQKKWAPEIPRWELRPPLAMKVLDLSDYWMDFARRKYPEFDPQQLRLVEDIGKFIADRKLPALVVYLPDRDRIIHSAWQGDPYRNETMAFAKRIEASFVDAADAFTGMTPLEIRQSFFHHDGHWNQSGSDRFARFMLDVLPKSFPRLLPSTK
jgi:hypothetical protein